MDLERSRGEPSPSSVPLVAIALPPSQAVPVVIECWARGEAVAVLDPSAPAAKTAERVRSVRPTRLVDAHGEQVVEADASVPADVAAVVVTSGTSATAKAVELTRAGMEASARAVHAELGQEPNDRWLSCLPLHHVAGLSIVARSFVLDIPLVTVDRFDPQRVADLAGECTLTAIVPVMLTRLLDTYAPIDRFRAVLLGGGPISLDLLRRARSRGINVRATYGMTETWGGVIYDGRPLPGVAVDLDDDSEILIDAPTIMRGYRDDPVATEAAFTDDGWFRTGDVGSFLGDGRLQVVDRKKDIVITGGVNVSPTHVERALTDHPKIADICVAGVADAVWGERVVAFVVPAHPANPPTLDELQSHAAPRLAAAELPRALSLVSSIPRTENGKPMRRRLTGAD
ncbi:MAG: class I adenylate-forming enzyme family protein [Acidimicrobiia bacterium]